MRGILLVALLAGCGTVQPSSIVPHELQHCAGFDHPKYAWADTEYAPVPSDYWVRTREAAETVSVEYADTETFVRQCNSASAAGCAVIVGKHCTIYIRAKHGKR